ncbi:MULTISPECIES: ribonuclease [unclassified Sphingomonas]|uniref:ribonuclease n=1 Tax=unclassified Sphingomonas TaxID=196159 RepID=UPI0007022E2B|nr:MULTISPECIES: ribonuclease [unclassified Sphingomonas]KQM61675.1 ribonuclease [Sphingomonas sp. Leaf16]KQN12948.1 ribonuclease [Sphingomonas sp. Leaf29]KQN19835.1 ribonuclease [Sphingomonas sp. Leaf32]
MADWIVERGIGEVRAARIEDGEIVEARIEPDDALHAGTILTARLVRRITVRNEGIVAWDGGEALLHPLPRAVTEGARLLVEITRPATPEPGKPKRARARPALPDAGPCEGPSLADLPSARLVGPFDRDLLGEAGWALLIEEATTGQVAFPGGALTIALTPAMTLIDIDGECAPAELAITGARAAARAIARLDLAGSIGIDLPTVGDKAVRLAAAEAVDAVLPQPYERTAVNGFGFLQIVRRRSRASLPELFAHVPAHARALLRQAERDRGSGERTLTAHPAVIAAIAARPDWVQAAERRLGTTLALRGDAGLAISAGHVQARFP